MSNYSRRDFLRTITLGGAVSCLLPGMLHGNYARGQETAPARPNIIVILADDFGWGSLTCCGAKHLQTPSCDRLAHEGRRFTNAYAPGSVCSPTRYAIMTGRYIWRTKVNDGFGLGESDPLLIEPGRMTLGSLAKSKGYHTAAVGKWHIGLGMADLTDWDKPLAPGPLSVGFDYFYGLATNTANQPEAYVEGDHLVNRVPNQIVSIEGKGRDRKTVGISPLRNPEEVMAVVTDKAVQWLEQNHENPFLLYFAPNAVHDPITPSAKFTGSPLGKYGDFIQELDASVGRVIETLEKYNILDNTLIVFTSDNGGVVEPKATEQMLAVKNGLEINGILRGGKHTIWEGGFREPFIVRWPGKVPANTVCDDIVCLTDILATLAGILGVPLPAGAAEDSIDVGSSWFGTKGATAARDAVILHAPQGSEYAIRQGPWKLIEHENRPTPLFNPKAKNIETSIMNFRKHLPKKDALYNLIDDPSETKDVAAEHPGTVELLRKLLREGRAKGATRPGVLPGK